MRHESLYLTDIVGAEDHIAEFIAETDFPAFQESELLRSAVVQKLAIIGEAAPRVSEALKTRYPRFLGHRSSPSVTSWSTRTSGSTGTWSGWPPGIVAPFCGSRLRAFWRRSPGAREMRLAGD